jgi:hypothetical protein
VTKITHFKYEQIKNLRFEFKHWQINICELSTSKVVLAECFI